jgi:hypothetical protein
MNNQPQVPNTAPNTFSVQFRIGVSHKPPTSVPRATGHNPDETIAAGPDDEPPVYRFTS